MQNGAFKRCMKKRKLNFQMEILAAPRNRKFRWLRGKGVSVVESKRQD